MAILKKVLWSIFVGISGLFTGLMVEKGLKSVYDPSESSKKTNEDSGEDETAVTETACEPSVSDSETEKSSTEEEETPSNEE